jgi:hypothetical protein
MMPPGMEPTSVYAAIQATSGTDFESKYEGNQNPNI